MNKKQCMLFSYENVLKIFEQLLYVGIRSSGIETVSALCNLGHPPALGKRI